MLEPLEMSLRKAFIESSRSFLERMKFSKKKAVATFFLLRRHLALFLRELLGLDEQSVTKKFFIFILALLQTSKKRRSFFLCFFNIFSCCTGKYFVWMNFPHQIDE